MKEKAIKLLLGLLLLLCFGLQSAQATGCTPPCDPNDPNNPCDCDTMSAEIDD